MASHAGATAQLAPAGGQQQGIHVIPHNPPVAQVAPVSIERDRLTSLPGLELSPVVAQPSR
jgi:hypothetical protein